MKRSSADILHDQERHVAVGYAEISDGYDIGMVNCCCGQSFLTKARDEHGVVAYKVWEYDFYSVRSFQKDVARLKDHAHSALSQTTFQLIAPIQHGFAHDGLRRGIAVVRTMVDGVRKTTPANRTFFH